MRVPRYLLRRLAYAIGGSIATVLLAYCSGAHAADKYVAGVTTSYGTGFDCFNIPPDKVYTDPQQIAADFNSACPTGSETGLFETSDGKNYPYLRSALNWFFNGQSGSAEKVACSSFNGACTGNYGRLVVSFSKLYVPTDEAGVTQNQQRAIQQQHCDLLRASNQNLVPIPSDGYSECLRTPNDPQQPSTVPEMGCKAFYTGVGISFGGGGGKFFQQFTGEVCGGNSDLDKNKTPDPSPTQTTEQQSDGENAVCAQKGDTKICLGVQQRNCGYVNGSKVCLEDIPPAKCTQTENGAMACRSNAPPTEKPDNGNPGQTATPDATVVMFGSSVQHNISIYSPTTVSNSTTGGGQGGTGGTTGGTTGGSTGGTGPGQGNGGTCAEGDECDDGIGGGGTCDAPPECEGSPIQCYHAEQLWKQACAVSLPKQEDVDDAIKKGLGLNDEGEGLINKAGDDVELGNLFEGGSASNACPEDYEINVSLGSASRTVTIPISNWCAPMQAIGKFVLVAAALFCLRIYKALLIG